MKTWILDEPGKIHMEEYAPSVLTDENNVKVRIEEVLFSSADYEIFTGVNKKRYPFVMGRYAVGVVSEVLGGDTSTLKKMDRVVIEPIKPCDQCEECLDGKHHKCAEMAEMGHNVNGLLQNFVDLPRSLLHVLPDSLSNEEALYVANVAFGINIASELSLQKGKHVAIFSDSKIGLILAQIIAHYQAIPVLISTRQSVLNIAEELGVYYCFNPLKTNITQEILTITGGRMCKSLVYFCNSDIAIDDLFDVATVNATVCVCGYGTSKNKISVSQICNKRLNIFSVSNGLGSFTAAINLLVTGTVSVKQLIGETLPFDTLDKTLAKQTTDSFAMKAKIIRID